MSELRYEPVLSSRATAFIIGLSRSRQRRLIELLFRLAKNPYQIGDYSEKDETGRDIHFLMVGDSVIGFWADHAVKEFRIVDIDEA
jgi:hypothetical protein